MGQPERRFRIRLAGFLSKFPHEIDEMPVSEFLECMLYEQMEPFGGLRGDLQAGIIAATLVNLKLPRGSTPYMPDAFMPKWEWKPKTATEPMSVPEQIEQWNLIRTLQNSKLPNA